MQPTQPNGTEDFTDDGWQGRRQSWSAIRWRRRARMLTGEPGDVLDMALQTAQRTFDEIDSCNTLLDTAAERAHALARALEGRLAEGGSAAAPCLLDELDALATRVAASEAARQVVRRILGMEEAGAGAHGSQRKAAIPYPGSQRPICLGMPSLYDAEQPCFGTWAEMLAARDRTAAQRAAVHARRSAVVTEHMTEIVTRLANVSVSDPALNEEALAELRHSYELWLACAEEWRRDNSCSCRPPHSTDGHPETRASTTTSRAAAERLRGVRPLAQG